VTRRRLDAELVRRGIIATSAEAQLAIRRGQVLIDGTPAGNPSTLVDAGAAVELVGPARPFVSRGGEKLEAALERFSIEVAGRRALDAGASTGGFTDCLLHRGAAHVVAVDVGYGQLAWSLRTDARVTVLERTNVRDLRPDDLPFEPEILVADLSFISLRLVVPVLAELATVDAHLVVLVKPQFEAARTDVAPGGVVRDAKIWARAIGDVADVCGGSGLVPVAVMASPIRGPAGNVEFLLHAIREGSGAIDVDEAIVEARGIAADQGAGAHRSSALLASPKARR
jgi:23S rRNA (cytidine1920-2'-O)/16S rRNA (cytidine1409-2'-O)-methyltransferase